MNKHYRDSFIPESDKSMTRFISRTMSRHMSGAVSRHMSRSVSPADQALLAKFGKYSERTDSNSRARESERLSLLKTFPFMENPGFMGKNLQVV